MTRSRWRRPRTRTSALAAAVAVVVLCHAVTGGASADAPPWDGARHRALLADGLVVHELTTTAFSTRPGLVFVWTEIDGAVAAVEDVRRFGLANDVYASAVDRTKLAAVSGGFYGLADSSNFIPVGLVIAGGRRISRLSRSNVGGVLLCEPGGGLRVVPIRAFKASPDVPCALQSKPLLVHDGEVDVRGDVPRMNRSAVAVTERGTVVLAGAFESFGIALSLREFAGFLVHLRRSAQLPIAAALNMDGGPGAHLYFPPLKLHYGDPGANFIPNVVHLTRQTAAVAPVR